MSPRLCLPLAGYKHPSTDRRMVGVLGATTDSGHNSDPCRTRRALHMGSIRRKHPSPGRAYVRATRGRWVRVTHVVCETHTGRQTWTGKGVRDEPFPEPCFMCSLCLVVRKFEFVLRRFLVVDIAGVASTQSREFCNKNVLAPRWDMKYRSRHPRLVQVQGMRAVELDLIHGLVRRPERLVYLCERSGSSARAEGEQRSRSPKLFDPRTRARSPSRAHAPMRGVSMTLRPSRPRRCSRCSKFRRLFRAAHLARLGLWGGS